MSELLIKGVIASVSFPVVYFIMRLMLGKSIVLKTVYPAYVFGIMTSFLSFWEAKMGIQSAWYIMPTIYLMGIAVAFYVKHALANPLKENSEKLERIAEGDLNIDVELSDSQTELGVLNNSIFELVSNLKRIMGDIALGSDNVVNASQQISSSSEQLSQGANEQAASIEEVSSTMEQIAASVTQNADNANETKQASLNVNSVVGGISDQTAEAVKANETMMEAVSLIEGIALETKILALNASVEAARAGDKGKGFGVVASEMRKLADKSREKIDEITTLSNTALTTSQENNNSIIEVLPQIASTTNKVSEIAAASNEQSNGVSEVNNAIQQLSSVTQENAASSEELAGSAEELSSQAEQLREVISYFKV